MLTSPLAGTVGRDAPGSGRCHGGVDCAVGETLYKVDDRHYPLVYRGFGHSSGAGSRQAGMGLMEPGQFTGEVGLLFGPAGLPDCVVVCARRGGAGRPRTDTELGPSRPRCSRHPHVRLRRTPHAAHPAPTSAPDAGGPRGRSSPAAASRVRRTERIPVSPAVRILLNIAQRAEIQKAEAEGPGVKVVVRGDPAQPTVRRGSRARALGLELVPSPRRWI